MNFNNHSNLEGQHAFLGASKYHWINYGEDKVAEHIEISLPHKKELYYMHLRRSALCSIRNYQNRSRH